MCKLKLSVITVLLYCFQIIAATPLCTYDEIAEKFSQPADYFTATTKDDLEKSCTEFVPTTNEIVDYLRQCRDKEIGKQLHFYEIIKETLTSICTSGSDLNKKYLAKVKCLKVDNEIGRDCGMAVMPSNYNEGSSCSNGFMMLGCLYKDALDKCGPDGLDVMKVLGRPIVEMTQRSCCEQRPQNSDANVVHLNGF